MRYKQRIKYSGGTEENKTLKQRCKYFVCGHFVFKITNCSKFCRTAQNFTCNNVNIFARLKSNLKEQSVVLLMKC